MNQQTTHDKSVRAHEPRRFAIYMPASNRFDVTFWGQSGSYHVASVNTAQQAQQFNDARGNTVAEVIAASTCSKTGQWQDFDELVSQHTDTPTDMTMTCTRCGQHDHVFIDEEHQPHCHHFAFKYKDNDIVVSECLTCGNNNKYDFGDM